MDAAFSPRVVGKFRPDFHSLEAMLGSPQFAGKEGEELVMAIYNHFTSPVDGTYHFWPSQESEGQPRIRRVNVDPIKIYNNYGFAICGQTSLMLYAVYTTAGLKARPYGLPGHALCEVFYDGRWHHYDVDMWSWFRTPQGHIASAFELARNAHALIVDNQNKSTPCNLPDRDLPGYANGYSKADVGENDINSVRPDWFDRSHNMDFHLRPGETILRTQENQGRFVMPTGWLTFKKNFEKEWHGTPRERYGLLRTFGNGRWIYEPNLSSKYRDVAMGVWEKKGVRQNASGLAGAGHAVFRMQSPYPFAGVPDWTDGKVTTASGIWLEMAGEGKIRAEITNPEGQWQTVCSCDGPFDEKIDVTSLMNARYECLIRFTLGAEALLKRFRFEGFFMVAPMSLPRLETGENPMELRFGDKHGLHTVPWKEIVDFRATADLPAQWFRARNSAVKPLTEGWNMIAPADESKPVEVMYRFDAPKGRKFGWAYVLTAHKEGPVDQPLRRAFTEWSLDGKDWMPLAEREISNTTSQWDCTMDSEILMPDGAPKLYLRIRSDTAICNVEFYGHLLVDDAADGQMEVTHSWKESGEVREFRVPAGQTDYKVVCGDRPYAHAIRMSRASVPGAANSKG